jgi:hypothetical protein
MGARDETLKLKCLLTVIRGTPHYFLMFHRIYTCIFHPASRVAPQGDARGPNLSAVSPPPVVSPPPPLPSPVAGPSAKRARGVGGGGDPRWHLGLRLMDSTCMASRAETLDERWRLLPPRPR